MGFLSWFFWKLSPFSHSSPRLLTCLQDSDRGGEKGGEWRCLQRCQAAFSSCSAPSEDGPRNTGFTFWGCFCFCSLGPRPQHTELPRLGVQSEPKLRPAPQLRATLDPSPTEQGQGSNPHPHGNGSGSEPQWEPRLQGFKTLLLDRSFTRDDSVNSIRFLFWKTTSS